MERGPCGRTTRCIAWASRIPIERWPRVMAAALVSPAAVIRRATAIVERPETSGPRAPQVMEIVARRITAALAAARAAPIAAALRTTVPAIAAQRALLPDTAASTPEAARHLLRRTPIAADRRGIDPRLHMGARRGLADFPDPPRVRWAAVVIGAAVRRSITPLRAPRPRILPEEAPAFRAEAILRGEAILQAAAIRAAAEGRTAGVNAFLLWSVVKILYPLTDD